MARDVSQEVQERQGTIYMEKDGPSHLLMFFWAAWGHDLWSRKASSTWRCCQTNKHFAVLRAFPGYCYSLISQYFLLHVFPHLAEDLGWLCGNYPSYCSSMLACTTASGAAVTPPVQDLGQPSTSAVPTSVYHGSWIHPALHPLCCITQSSVLEEERQQVTNLHPVLHKPRAGNCDKHFSKLWISRTQLIYCPLSWMHDNTKISKNYSLSSYHPSKIQDFCMFYMKGLIISLYLSAIIFIL